MVGGELFLRCGDARWMTTYKTLGAMLGGSRISPQRLYKWTFATRVGDALTRGSVTSFLRPANIRQQTKGRHRYIRSSALRDSPGLMPQHRAACARLIALSVWTQRNAHSKRAIKTRRPAALKGGPTGQWLPTKCGTHQTSDYASNRCDSDQLRHKHTKKRKLNPDRAGNACPDAWTSIPCRSWCLPRP